MTEIPFNKDLSAEMVLSLLDYDEITGIFRWKVQRAHKTPVGSIAGSVMGGGYISIMISGKSYLAHRLAWLVVHGTWPPVYMDHIDGDAANNAIKNLRLVTKQQNCQNSLGSRKGYHINDRKKYRAAIMVSGKVKLLGDFLTAGEARSAYLAATIKYFGEYSVTNRPSFDEVETA